MFKAEFQFERDSFALALEAPGGGYDGFLDVIDNYGGTKAANLAKYYAGISYLNLGRYEDAITFLESHKPKGNITSITKFGALGDAYSEVGDFGKALSSYERAAKGGTDVLTPYYLYKLGLLSYQQKDNAKALKAFQRISDDFPKSIEASEAAKYISLLN
jgi:tetratricopeptide (TPR) repeat protein